MCLSGQYVPSIFAIPNHATVWVPHTVAGFSSSLPTKQNIIPLIQLIEELTYRKN